MALQTARRIGATITTAGTLTAGQHTPVDATGGNLTVTLPTGVTAGAHLSVEKRDTTANTVTVSGSIRGATATVVLSWQYETITLRYDGATWTPTEGHKTRAALDATYSPLKTSSRAQRIAAAVQSFDLSRALWPVMQGDMAPRVDTSAANAVSSISNGVTIPVTTTGPFALSGAAAFTTNVAGALPGYVGPNIDHMGNVQTWFEFVTDAPVFEVSYLGTASPKFRLIVDGETTSALYTTAAGASGAPHRMTVTHGTRKWRRYLLDSSQLYVSGVTIGPTDTLTTAVPAPSSVAIMGDSYIVNQAGEFGLTAARILGLRPMLNGAAGTGYNNNSGGGSNEVFAGADRLPVVLAAKPDALVIVGGINDSTATLQADALNVITTARATLPDLPVVLVGSQSPPGTTSAASKSALLQAAAASGKAAFVDMVTGNVYAATGTQLIAGQPWITGTGNHSAPTGTGNADLYIDTDTIHPYYGAGAGDATNGFVYHGIRLAQALAVALPNANA